MKVIMNFLKFLMSLCSLMSLTVFGSEPQKLTLNDAIVNTLTKQKEIEISFYNIKRQSGVLQQSAGPFDPVLNESVTDVISNTIIKSPPNIFSTSESSAFEPDHIHFKSNDIIAEGSITKQTRIGTSFLLAGQYESFLANRKVPNTHASQIFFQVTQPFLRSFLYGINRQREQANAYELEAVSWDTMQTIADKIFNTVTNYWNVVGAQETLIVIKNALERLEKLKEHTQQLIKGEQLPAEDINQAIAVISSQYLIEYQNQNNLYKAKQQLLFSMGSFDDDSPNSYEIKFEIEDSFPNIVLDERRIQEMKNWLIELSFVKRFDVLAAETREQVTGALLIGAKNQVLPELDLIGSVTVNNLHPTFQTSQTPPGFLLTSQEIGLKKNVSVNYAIGLSLSVPFNNDQALGFLQQQKANNTQAYLQTQLLKQNLINMILQTISNQVYFHKQLDESHQVIEKYSRLVNDENERLSAGFGSVFVLLDFETRLINAQITNVELVRQYIQGMATLRYLTGTLIEVNEDCYGFDVEKLWCYP